MVHRGPSYYCRIYENYREKWINLGRNEAKAVRKFHQLRGQGMPKGMMNVETMSSLLPLWLDAVGRDWGPAHRRAVVARFSQYLFSHLGPVTKDPDTGEVLSSVRVNKVTKEQLSQYRTCLEAQGLSPSTVKHGLVDCRSFFRWAEEEGYIDRTPFPARLIPQVDRGTPRPFSPEEEEILRTLPGTHGWMCRLGLGTGLRWNELNKLQAGDLHGDWLKASNLKNKKRRTKVIPLAHEPALVAEIRNHVGFLMPYKSNCSFRKLIIQKTGILDFSPHRMRHTFACRWLARGGSILALSKILGHSSVRTTEIYGAVSNEYVRAESERLGRQA